MINAEPLFIDPLNYDFRPDTLSPLLDAADLIIADKYPFDIRYYPRFNDAGPDIGVYERQIGEISEEK